MHVMCVPCCVDALLRTIEVRDLLCVIYVPCKIGGLLRTIEVIVMHVMLCESCSVGALFKNYRSHYPYACGVCTL